MPGEEVMVILRATHAAHAPRIRLWSIADTHVDASKNSQYFAAHLRHALDFQDPLTTFLDSYRVYLFQRDLENPLVKHVAGLPELAKHFAVVVEDYWYQLQPDSEGILQLD